MRNLLILIAVTFGAPQGSDFGAKFLTDLRDLFGRLQQGELTRAFDQAKSIQCSDLVANGGLWKQVAFLNDDRKIANWHFETLDAVRRDLVTFVFRGDCRAAPSVSVAASYPVQESLRQFEKGEIALSQVAVRHNDPIDAQLDASTGVYHFLIPYLYVERKTGFNISYTLSPPTIASKPEEAVAEEFRCKALSDATLTYRFLLCRTLLVARTSGIRELGNSGYYILSDGKEASSKVELQFKPDQ